MMNSTIYVAVVQEFYARYVPLAHSAEGRPDLASNGVHQHQGVSDEIVCPSGYPMYDVMNPYKYDNSRHMRLTICILYIKDKHMNRAPSSFFLFLFSQETQ